MPSASKIFVSRSRMIDILGPMQRDEKILEGFDLQSFMMLARIDAVGVTCRAPH